MDPQLLNVDNGPDQPPPGFGAKGGKYFYDTDAGERPILFIETFCSHYQGEFAGQPFLLTPLQKNVLRHVFGTKHSSTGQRRYRMAYVEAGKGFGKSQYAAAIALYGLCGDQEPGAEVYAVATNTKQANIVFDASRKMVAQSAKLSRALVTHRFNISHPKSQSKYEVLSGEDGGKQGPKPSLIICDEIHEWPDRRLWDSLESAIVKRPNCLIVGITNAGESQTSICWELHEHALRVMAGESDDETFFPCVLSAPESADWTDPEVWKLANPNLGLTVSFDSVAAQCIKAKENPALEAMFRRLYLSQWITSGGTKWLSSNDWDACPSEIDPTLLKGRPCYAGLDLSSTNDLTALVLVFPPNKEGDAVVVLSKFYVPAESVIQLEKEHRVPYRTWKTKGFIVATPGNVVDYDAVRKDILEVNEIHPIKQLGLDRGWQGQALESQLVDDGFDVVPVGQGWRSQSQPLKEIERMVKAKRLNHGGHPVLKWHAMNAVVKADDAANYSLSKKLSREKIDGMAALTNAVFVWQMDNGKRPATTNYYAKNPLVVLDWD